MFKKKEIRKKSSLVSHCYISRIVLIKKLYIYIVARVRKKLSNPCTRIQSLISVIKHLRYQNLARKPKAKIVCAIERARRASIVRRGDGLFKGGQCVADKKREKKKCSRAFLSVIYMAIPARHTCHIQVLLYLRLRATNGNSVSD